MFKKLYLIAIVLFSFFMVSCTEEDSTWNPYHNWQARNAEWFMQVTDTARTAIAEAKAQSKATYGTEDKWEEFTDWRRFKSLQKSATYDSGDPFDSICVRIIKSGIRDEQSLSPCYTDTVRVNFRGWLMKTNYQNETGAFVEKNEIFTQTYFGDFNPETAAPSLMPVFTTVEGYSTALQYMIPGDDWKVYIPQQMAYGQNGSSAIPAYSTLLFRINLVQVFPAGSGVKDWK